jgi:heterodisulfide reductase subunit A-like polyferredoxin
MHSSPAFATLAALRVTSRTTAAAAAAATVTAMARPTHAHGFDYDLLVLGAGSGGVRAARIAAGHGAHVAVAERAALGGSVFFAFRALAAAPASGAVCRALTGSSRTHVSCASTALAQNLCGTSSECRGRSPSRPAVVNAPH